jgi:hypothetical protein
MRVPKGPTGFREYINYHIDDLVARMSRESHTDFEYLCDGRGLVKPYFDIEEYHSQRPNEEYMDDFKHKCLIDLVELFTRSGRPLEVRDIAVAQRHRAVPKGGREMYKISYRIYVQGYAMKHTHVKQLAAMGSLAWDTSVYKPQDQLLGLVGNSKGGGDFHVLRAITHQADLKAFVAQYLLGDEVVIDMPSITMQTATRFNKGPVEPNMSGNGHPEDVVRRVMGLLRGSGDTASVHDPRGDKEYSLYFKTRGVRQCPNGQRHENNNFYINLCENGTAMYHCLANSCGESYPIGKWMGEESPIGGWQEAIVGKLGRRFKGLSVVSSTQDKFSASFSNKKCPLCGLKHKGEPLVVQKVMRDMYMIRVGVEGCQGELICDSPVTSSFVGAAKNETALVKAFVHDAAGLFVYSPECAAFYRRAGQVWIPVDGKDIVESLKETMGGVLCELTDHFRGDTGAVNTLRKECAYLLQRGTNKILEILLKKSLQDDSTRIELRSPPPPSQWETFDPLYYNGLKQYARFQKEQLAYANRFFIQVKENNAGLLLLTYYPGEEGLQCDVVKSFKRFSETEFKVKWAECIGDDTHDSFCSQWLSNPGKRSVSRLVFDPRGQTAADEFNLFLGLRIERVYNMDELVPDYDKIRLIRRHIKEVLSSNDEAIEHYIYCWLKDVIVRKRKTGVALVWISPPGCGKGIFWSSFIGHRVMGGDGYGDANAPFVQISDESKLVGKFNGLAMGRLLINGDELSNLGYMHSMSNALKGLITEPTVVIEKKGLDCITVKDYANYVFTSNNVRPVKVEREDRRYFVAKLNDAYRGDRRYFNCLFEEASSDEAAAQFYKFLMDYNTNGTDVRDIPMTLTRQELMGHETPKPILFLAEWIDTPGCAKYAKEGFIPTSHLFVLFTEFMRSSNMSDRTTKDGMVKCLTSHMGLKTGRETQEGSRARGLTFEKKDLENVRTKLVEMGLLAD